MAELPQSDSMNISPEQGRIAELDQKYQEILATFSPDDRVEEERAIVGAYTNLSQKLAEQKKFKFDENRQAILRLKLARHFQKLKKDDTVDVSTLYDAIIESPRFIDTDQGSLGRLLEVHEQKTLQKIAEARKRRAEMEHTAGFNPYENLFTTKSGNYYMARLLNMPHLEKESEYMDHCVGTSDSYVNRMKRGKIEILSFRMVKGDIPIMTIEYNLKTNTIEQMKKRSDKYLSQTDPYFEDVIDALKQLRATKTDAGRLRDFGKIAQSELGNIKVKDFCVLTESGEVSISDFNPDSGSFVLKIGKAPIGPTTSAQDAAKIVRVVEGISCQPEEIALSREQVTVRTKVYIGKPFPGFFKWLPDYIQHIYFDFPEGKITREFVVAGGKTGKEYEEILKQKGIKISSWGGQILKKPEFATLMHPEKIDLIRLRIGDLGFDSSPATDQLFQRAKTLGLELCPPEVGPEFRLKYEDQPLYDWLYVGMKPMTASDGFPYVFALLRLDDGLWLRDFWARPDDHWFLGHGLVFRLRK